MSINIQFIDDEFSFLSQDEILRFRKLKNSTLVITGGAGFVGQWILSLVDFLNRNYSFNTDVKVIDRQCEKLKSTRPELFQSGLISLINVDVRNLQEFPFDTNWVIHGAATPDNRLHASNPCEVMSVIANGTMAVLRALERCSHLNMFLNISSGLIYGTQEFGEKSVTEKSMFPVNCGTVTSAYVEAKRFAETLCQSFRSQYKTPIVSVRPFTFMGPFQSLDAPWALSNFIKDALINKGIRLLGDGNTLRSYMYASDMAVWILSILLNSESGEIYNIGSPHAISLIELAKIISDELNLDSDILLNIGDFNTNKNNAFIPNVDLATHHLGLKIHVDFLTGLKKTITWYNKNLGVKAYA